MRPTWLLALLTALLWSTRPGDARQVGPSNAVLTTRHLAFHSDFAVNLNDALVMEFIATRDGRPGLFAAGPEKTCFDALPDADRAGWARATEYYRANRSTPSQLLLLRLQLGGLVQRELLPEGTNRQVLDAFATARGDGGAAYRQCRWPSQDAANRAWIASLQPLLAAHETALAAELPRVFQTPWNFLPFRVDVMRRGNPNGGNMSSDIDGRPHIVVSSEHPATRGSRSWRSSSTKLLTSSRRPASRLVTRFCRLQKRRARPRRSTSFIKRTSSSSARRSGDGSRPPDSHTRRSSTRRSCSATATVKWPPASGLQ